MTARNWMLVALFGLFFAALLVVGLVRADGAYGTDAQFVKKNADNFCFS